MDYRQLEEIDNYHSGRLTPEESIAFENKIAADPDLKLESDLQSDIINGLKDVRKSQLKARMDAVDLSPSWIEFMQQSTLMKSFGGVAVASLVGAGVYFNAEPRVESESNPVVVDAPSYEDPQVIWSLGLEELPPLVNAMEEEKVEKQTLASLQVDSEPVTEGVSEEPVVKEVKSSESFTPDFNAPIAENVSDEEAPQTSNLDKFPEDASVVRGDEPIDVKTEITKNLKVQYKYYDGKLFLSGDFDRAPYEILEINSASGRRIYVKYLDKYYKVGTTDKLTDLPEVTDKAVIDELKLLRQNK